MAKLQLDDLEDLNFIVGAAGPARGAAKAPLSLAYSRDLSPEDIAQSEAAPLAAQAPLIQRLRHAHHAIARLVAEGRKGVEISAITGYSQSRISILQNDPAFSELVEYYRGQVEQVFWDTQTKLKHLGDTALEILQERLEENPNAVGVESLRKIMAEAYDRGPAPAIGGNAKPSALPGQGPVAIQINFVKPAPQGAIDVTPSALPCPTEATES